jgi:hypothetical protein
MGSSNIYCVRTRSTYQLVIFGSFVIAIAVVFSSCAKERKPVIGPGANAPSISKATYNAYRKGGWVPLVQPDSRFVPGTIFESKENTAPRWISSLETCGVPKEALAPVHNDTETFKYSGDASYGASAVLNIRGVSAGPNFSKATSATFQQSDSGASAIDIQKVMTWMNKNPAAFSSICESYLSQPDVYVAQESYRVGNGTYTLKNSKGGGISIKVDVLKLSADANAKVTGDSSLTLTVPVYTAVHQAVYAKDVLQTLTQPSRGPVAHADDAILSKLPY